MKEGEFMAIKAIETTDKDRIIEYLESKSEVMEDYVKEHNDSEFYLVYKYMTHSDLTNRGKRNGNKETIEKDFLYYLTVEEMHNIEKTQKKPFESAKQSNIGVPPMFFNTLGIEQLKRRKGKQETQHKHICINDYANVYVVNETAKFFTGEYTRKILDTLEKKPIWYDENIDIDLVKEKNFTPIKLSHAIHGIGTSADTEFAKLRMNIFKNDILILLIETRPDFSKRLFIMLEKNPIFYSIIGMTNSKWQKYSEKQAKIQEKNLRNKTVGNLANEEKTRKQQSKWRDLLAEEMMNYSAVDGEVFCPFTYLNCNYESLGTLFRASHIKAFKDCDSAEEAYDVNNGLLLCANVDALFDKHLITVDENKNLVFSFLIENNISLISRLLLTQPIFKLVLNDKRMDYMKYHRNEFIKLEKNRKGENL